ncbi:histone-lysine N-methyltransferase ASH1L [Trichonephila clavipes]|nr:histone-lysine N-methyltransferase ASH1L [Trichonephila clavipes]
MYHNFRYQKVIPVTDPSSGRRSISTDPRKARRKEVHFPKKKFLRAGLYSSYFKQDVSSMKKSSSKKSRSREIKEYVPEDHECGLLPPPIHVGRYLREKRSEYKLPYDLWWLYKNKQLVYNDELANNYKKIRTNVYVDIKPDLKNEDQQPCMCVPPRDGRKRGCGMECLNRMMYVECTPQLCPCKDLCSNQRIFKHEWSPGLERFMTKDRGWGIRTTEFIRSGEFILEYVGEVVSDTEFRHRMAERYRNDQHHYCLSLDSGTVIDGYRLAGEGRFVNHSCEPNCEMQKWYVNGHYRVGLFSLRDIYPNTELCYDYNFINYNLETQQLCRCGSPKCRGFIGGRSQRLNGQAKEKVRQVKQSKAIADSKKGPGRPKKRKDERPVEIQKEHIKNEYLPYNRQSFTIQMKPMSHQQRCYVQKHHCFLLRNYEKVKKAKDQARVAAEKEAERENALNKQDAFHAQFTALNTARSVKTRRLANAEENTELAKTAKLAQVFKDIFTAVTSCKGDDGVALASPFFQLPSKRRNSSYYTKIKFPIDFATIEKNIITGQYKSVDAFEDDFLRLFENAEDYHGRTSDLGHKISLLRKVYDGAKTDAMILFEDILGDSVSSMFASLKSEASTLEPHSDSFNDTSRRRRSNCSTNNFQTPCRSKSYIYKSKRPFRALPLTPEHRQLRLQWCQARSMWNVTEWKKVVFSDESRFVLGTDDNRVRVWRRPGERYNSPHTARIAGVMVWGAIAYDSRSTLIVMRGTLMGQRYVDDILRPHVGPFLNGLPGAIFQQDNAHLHTARVAQDFLRHFQTLPWPARSPNLSPVELVWDQLKHQMPSCHSVHDLELAVQDLWAHLLRTT